MAALAGTSLLRDDYKGRAKLVVDSVSETLLGATFVGPEVGELVHAATVAVVGKVPLEVLWHAVPSYPTVAEIWLRLLETWRSAATRIRSRDVTDESRRPDTSRRPNPRLRRVG